MLTRRVAVLEMLGVSLLSAAVRGEEAKYIGGSVTSIPQDTEGKLDMSGEKALVFTAKKGSITVPYENITTLEFGQKAGRRIGVAIMVSPIALLSKKRRHFITIGYKDQSEKTQGIVLELAKGLPKMVITTIEARSGVKCEYESEEARKHVHG